MYDLSKGSSWVVSRDLPQATDRIVGANLGGVFYIMGGAMAGVTESKQILAWSPDTDLEGGEWSVRSEEMLEARAKHAVTVVVYSDISIHCI